MITDNMATELIPKANDCILCVKVGKIRRENLYEMTRKYWKVSLTRALAAMVFYDSPDKIE